MPLFGNEFCSYLHEMIVSFSADTSYFLYKYISITLAAPIILTSLHFEVTQPPFPVSLVTATPLSSAGPMNRQFYYVYNNYCDANTT